MLAALEEIHATERERERETRATLRELWKKGNETMDVQFFGVFEAALEAQMKSLNLCCRIASRFL